MFGKSLIVIGGIGISQLISFAALPLLSRLYDPAQFGFFTIASSACWLTAVVATLQLEHAIILPKLEKSANALVAVILAVGFLISFFFGCLFVIIFSIYPALLYKNVNLYLLIGLLVVTIFGIVCTQALRSLLVRRGQFHLVARGAVIMALVTALAAILSAIAKGHDLHKVGLILGQSVGLLTTAVYWIFVTGRSQTSECYHFQYRRMLATIRHYWRFAFLLTGSNAVKTSYGRLPTFIISLVGGSAAAGLYGMVERVISAPTVLLAQAVASVFRHKAGRYAQMRDSRQIMHAYWKVVLVSSMFSIPVFAFGIWLSPMLFPVILGEEWEQAGHYASILLVGEAFVFVLAMVEDTSILVGKNKYRFFWHLGQFLSIGSILLLAYHGKIMEVETALWSLVAIRIIFSLIDLVCFYQVLFKYRRAQ